LRNGGRLIDVTVSWTGRSCFKEISSHPPTFFVLQIFWNLRKPSAHPIMREMTPYPILEIASSRIIFNPAFAHSSRPDSPAFALILVN
jgi:hypothetical protein